eukprot:7623364-Pyramimonas_sp.AAC.1
MRSMSRSIGIMTIKATTSLILPPAPRWEQDNDHELEEDEDHEQDGKEGEHQQHELPLRSCLLLRSGSP